MGNHLCAWADSPTIVELPSQYKEDEVYALLHSIDFHQLAQEADKFAPGLLKDKVSFHFELLTFHSFLGKPDHMAVRIDVNAPQNWNKVSDLKTFLANYLEKKFSGAKRTTTILQ
jgi:hypothetical protein